MNRINEFKPCPICGKTDRLNLTQKEFYYHLMHNYKSGMITVRCWRCDLALNAYSSQSITNNYEILVGKLKEKWNGIKR